MNQIAATTWQQSPHSYRQGYEARRKETVWKKVKI